MEAQMKTQSLSRNCKCFCVIVFILLAILANMLSFISCIYPRMCCPPSADFMSVICFCREVNISYIKLVSWKEFLFMDTLVEPIPGKLWPPKWLFWFKKLVKCSQRAHANATAIRWTWSHTTANPRYQLPLNEPLCLAQPKNFHNLNASPLHFPGQLVLFSF